MIKGYARIYPRIYRTVDKINMETDKTRHMKRCTNIIPVNLREP